jgi:hypothetical protein
LLNQSRVVATEQREQFGNPEEREGQTLEPVSRALVKIQRTEKPEFLCYCDFQSVWNSKNINTTCSCVL